MPEKNHGGTRPGAGRPKNSRDKQARRDALTPKQQAFVAEYLVDLNATQAAIRAGYGARNANRTASELLGKTQVRAAIDAAKIARTDAVGADAEWVLRRLVAEVEADFADLYSADGSIKPIHEWPPIWRQGLVAGIKHQELRDSEGNRTGEFIVDIKISDRIRRLELIGKHVRVNAFQERVAFSGFDGLAERLSRIPSDLDFAERARTPPLPAQATLAPPAEHPAHPQAPAGVPRPHLNRPEHRPALGDDWNEPTQPTPPALPAPPAPPAGSYKPVLPLKPASK
jgi:phage terminase small subunit